MEIAHVRLGSGIRWNISPDDPKSIALKSLGGARLLNPLLFQEDNQPAVFPLSGGKSHVLTNSLSFVLPDGLDIVNKYAETVAPLVKAIRVMCKQASLLPDFAAITTTTIGRLPKVVAPPRTKGKYVMFGTYRIETALSFDSIRPLARIAEMPEPSLHHEILLDAIHAHERGDHRQSVLYAAIAVESMARTVLDNQYVDVIEGRARGNHINVVSFPQAKGVVVQKDPIYTLLSETNSFSRLLNELPLYLLRRSLLCEDPLLYKACIRLYQTRNKLGHGRPVDDGDSSLYEISRAGSLEALAAATAAFDWFGDGGYRLPVYDSVEISV